MRKSFQNLNIEFSIGDVSFQLLNAIFEKLERNIPKHSHGSGTYEIHYIPAGYGALRAAHSSYAIVPKTLYVTGAHVEHSQFFNEADPMREYCIYVKKLSPGKGRKFDIGHKYATDGKRYRDGADKDGRHKNGHDGTMSDFCSTPFWFGADRENLLPLMEQIFEDLTLHPAGYKTMVSALLTQLLIKCARNYGHDSRQALPDETAPSGQTTVILEDYFLYEYQNLSLEELSRRLSLSPRQTERLLKTQYGKTFQEKKIEARMSAAAVMLASPMSITAIAEQLGYSSMEHFSTAFKKYYGLSPSHYRKKTPAAPLHATRSPSPFTSP